MIDYHDFLGQLIADSAVAIEKSKAELAKITEELNETIAEFEGLKAIHLSDEDPLIKFQKLCQLMDKDY